jgi:hypothetical protein
VGAEEVQEPPLAPAPAQRSLLHRRDVDRDEVHQPHFPRRRAGIADDLVPFAVAAIRVWMHLCLPERCDL